MVKDVRDVSYGVEADIEISKGRIKGLARIKIWGPSKSSKGKNKCTIILTKYPHSDGKYVTMLSRKVVKPLLDLYLKGEGWKSIMTKINKTNRDRIQCTKCEKSFWKVYIKTHVAKMHDSSCYICEKRFDSIDELKLHKTDIHSQAANDIVKEVTQEEDISNSLFHNNNEFTCKECNLQFKTNLKRLEHNENRHIQDNWPDSGTKRDLSMIKTTSVSEPKKKKTANELEMKERSDNMDRKILEKRKKDEMDEMLEKKILEENKRQKEIKESLENKKKNMKKSSEVRQPQKQVIVLPENVKELPEIVKRKCPDSKEYFVIGDGACCLNCLAAWIFLDPKEGPTLGRDLNTHIAEYRPYYKNKLSFPLTITNGGGERQVFEEGEEDKFFDTLVTSSAASYMWRESHDMIAVSNFTNMEVEVIVYDQKILKSGVF